MLLQVVAHPSRESSFTLKLAAAFAEGAVAAGIDRFQTFNLFFDKRSVSDWQQQIKQATLLNLVFPCWWELPPARMVEWLQTVFVRDFAHHGRGKKLLNLPTTVIVSVGMLKTFNTVNLSEAMAYCGLKPTFFCPNGVGPGLPAETAAAYLDLARRLGRSQVESTQLEINDVL